MKTAYQRGMSEKRAAEDDEDVEVLPPKKRGRPLFLGEALDLKVQEYLRRVRDGGVVTTRTAMATARGILLSYNRSSLCEFGGHVEVNQSWAYGLLRRMKLVKRKVTTARSKHSFADFDT